MNRSFSCVLGIALSILVACSGGDADPAPDATAPDAVAVDATAVDGPAIDAAIDAPPLDAPDPVEPGLILRYHLDGNTSNSGGLAPSFDGVATSATYVPGVHGQALQFSGTQASALSIAGTGALFATRPALTIGLWFRDDAVPPPGGPVVRYLLDNRCCPTDNLHGMESYHGVNSNPALTTCSHGGCASFTYPLGGWHHLLYRYDTASGARLELFLDGAPAATIANLQHLPLFGAGTADLQVGFNTLFSVDDLVVYERVFSDAEQCTQIVGGTWTGAACTPPAIP